MLSEDRKARRRQNLRNLRYSFDRALIQLKAYEPHRNLLSHELLRGKIDAETLNNCPVYIDEDDLLAGSYPPVKALSEEEQAERNQYISSFAMRGSINGSSGSNTGHRVVDYEKLLEKGILGVIDDFERGLNALETAEDIEAVKEGMTLVYNKLQSFLKQNGVAAIDTKDQVFDTDLHEAITMIPAPDESMKGKVVDCVQKGYFLNDKVIRFAKVVVAN